MADTNKIHVGDVGVSFQLKFVDQAGVVIPINGATLMQMFFQKPDGTDITKTASYATDGLDGVMKYVTTTNDLDVSGTWQYQGYAEVGGAKMHTNTHKFKVAPNLQ